MSHDYYVALADFTFAYVHTFGTVTDATACHFDTVFSAYTTLCYLGISHWEAIRLACDMYTGIPTPWL